MGLPPTGAACPGVPKNIGRGYSRDLDVGPFQLMIDSWDLHLRAEAFDSNVLSRGLPRIAASDPAARGFAETGLRKTGI